MDKDIYDLRIQDLTPSTFPMARLAKYLAELSNLMGEKESVHFESVIKGSAVLKCNVDPSATAIVTNRIQNPAELSETRKAFDNLNTLLNEDNTIATLSKNGAKIINFDGVEKNKSKKIIYPKEICSIRGELIKIGGKDQTIPFDLIEQGTNENIHGNITSKELAINLAKHLFSTIEVTGTGYWEYYPDKDIWKICDFAVIEVKELSNKPINHSFKQLASKSNPGGENPLDILKIIRSDN